MFRALVFHCGQTFFFLSSSVLFLCVCCCSLISFLPFKTLAKRTRKSTQVNASLVRLAKGSQTDSQVAKNVNFTQLVSTCAGWPNGKKTSSNWVASQFELDQSQRKLSQEDAMQVDRRKWVAKRNASWTQVENLRRLASPFGQVV